MAKVCRLWLCWPASIAWTYSGRGFARSRTSHHEQELFSMQVYLRSVVGWRESRQPQSCPCKPKAVMSLSPILRCPLLVDGGIGKWGRKKGLTSVGEADPAAVIREVVKKRPGAARGGGATRYRGAPDQAAGAPLSGERAQSAGQGARRGPARLMHCSVRGCGSLADGYAPYLRDRRVHPRDSQQCPDRWAAPLVGFHASPISTARSRGTWDSRFALASHPSPFSKKSPLASVCRVCTTNNRECTLVGRLFRDSPHVRRTSCKAWKTCATRRSLL